MITQGITARVARRQASSAKAGTYAERTPKLVALAWKYAPMSITSTVLEWLTVLADISR